MKYAALIFGDDDRPKTAAGKSPEPGQIVRTIDGSVYRVASKIAGPDGVVVKLANLQGSPVQTPSNFRPVGLAVARFASWLRYHLAYNKDFDLYVNAYVEQYNNQHKNDPLPYPTGEDGQPFRWANWFQKKVAPKLFVRGRGNAEDQQAMKDDIIHEMLFNTLGERHVLDQFVAKAKSLGVNRQNAGAKLRTFLISTFMYRIDEMQNKLNARSPEEEISMYQPGQSDEGESEVNILETEEHGVGDAEFQGAEARRDVARFRESFRKWLAHTAGPKASENFILMFDIFWRLLQTDENADVKRNDLQEEWIEKTGLSFGSFKDYFTRLPEMMESFIVSHQTELGGENSVFVELMNAIRNERTERERKERRQKQKARPAMVSSLKIAEGVEEDVEEAAAATVSPMKVADGIGPDLAQAISNSENPDVVDPDIKQPTKTVPEAAKEAASKTAQQLVRGDQLDPQQKQQVLNAFPYRWTRENPHRVTRECPNCDVYNDPFVGNSAAGHNHPVIPLQSDDEWVRDHAFWFTNQGKLFPRRSATPASYAPEPESAGLFASVAHRFAMDKSRKQADFACCDGWGEHKSDCSVKDTTSTSKHTGMLGHDFNNADGQAINNETEEDTGRYLHRSDNTEITQRRMAAQELWECMDCGAKGELDPKGGGCAACGSQAISPLSEPVDPNAEREKKAPFRETPAEIVQERMDAYRDKFRTIGTDKTAQGSGNTTVTFQNQNVTQPGSPNKGEPMAVPEAIDQAAGPHSPNAPMTAPRTPGITPKIVNVPPGTEGESMGNMASAKNANEFEELFGGLLDQYKCPQCGSINVDVTPTEEGYDIYCEDCERVTPSHAGATPGVSGFHAQEPEFVDPDLEMEPEEPPYEHQHEGADKTADALFEEQPLQDVTDLDVLVNMPQERKAEWLKAHGWTLDESYHGASWWMQQPMWSKDGHEEDIPYQETDNAIEKEVELLEKEDAQAADTEPPEAEGEIDESEFAMESAEEGEEETEDPMQVAKTILEQLGGNKFRAMTGAKNFVGKPNGISFTLPGAGGFTKNGINRVFIELTPNDTYRVNFSRVRAGKIGWQSNHDDIYAENLRELFERETGLATSLGKGVFGAGSNSGEDDPRGVGTNYNDEFYEHRTEGLSSEGMLSGMKEAALNEIRTAAINVQQGQDEQGFHMLINMNGREYVLRGATADQFRRDYAAIPKPEAKVNALVEKYMDKLMPYGWSPKQRPAAPVKQKRDWGIPSWLRKKEEEERAVASVTAAGYSTKDEYARITAPKVLQNFVNEGGNIRDTHAVIEYTRANYRPEPLLVAEVMKLLPPKMAAPAAAPAGPTNPLPPNVQQQMNLVKPQQQPAGPGGTTVAIMPGQEEEQGGLKRHTVEPELPNAKYHMMGRLILAEERRLTRAELGSEIDPEELGNPDMYTEEERKSWPYHLGTCSECGQEKPVQWEVFDEFSRAGDSTNAPYAGWMCEDCSLDIAQDI